MPFTTKQRDQLFAIFLHANRDKSASGPEPVLRELWRVFLLPPEGQEAAIRSWLAAYRGERSAVLSAYDVEAAAAKEIVADDIKVTDDLVTALSKGAVR